MNVIDFGHEECKKIAGYLDAYLSNELLVETSQTVAEHLEKCPMCADEFDARVKLKNAVQRVVQAQTVPPDVAVRLRSRLEEEAAKGFFRSWAMPLAVAATLVIGVFSGWFALQSQPETWQTAKADQEAYIDSLYEQAAHVVRVGLGDHVHCAYYRKFPKNAPTVEELAATLGQTNEGLTDIINEKIPQGFHVVLGHLCKYKDRQYVHVALRRDDELLSVVITRREGAESFERDQLVPVLSAAGVPIYAAGADRFELAGFETDDYLAFVVSNLPRQGNLQIAEALAPELRTFLQNVQG
jgi:anti-sigma factor RsiW